MNSRRISKKRIRFAYRIQRYLRKFRFKSKTKNTFKVKPETLKKLRKFEKQERWYHPDTNFEEKVQKNVKKINKKRYKKVDMFAIKNKKKKIVKKYKPYTVKEPLKQKIFYVNKRKMTYTPSKVYLYETFNAPKPNYYYKLPQRLFRIIWQKIKVRKLYMYRLFDLLHKARNLRKQLYRAKKRKEYKERKLRKNSFFYFSKKARRRYPYLPATNRSLQNRATVKHVMNRPWLRKEIVAPVVKISKKERYKKRIYKRNLIKKKKSKLCVKNLKKRIKIVNEKNKILYGLNKRYTKLFRRLSKIFKLKFKHKRVRRFKQRVNFKKIKFSKNSRWKHFRRKIMIKKSDITIKLVVALLSKRPAFTAFLATKTNSGDKNKRKITKWNSKVGLKLMLTPRSRLKKKLKVLPKLKTKTKTEMKKTKVKIKRKKKVVTSIQKSYNKTRLLKSTNPFVKTLTNLKNKIMTKVNTKSMYIFCLSLLVLVRALEITLNDHPIVHQKEAIIVLEEILTYILYDLGVEEMVDALRNTGIGIGITKEALNVLLTSVNLEPELLRLFLKPGEDNFITPWLDRHFPKVPIERPYDALDFFMYIFLTLGYIGWGVYIYVTKIKGKYIKPIEPIIEPVKPIEPIIEPVKAIETIPEALNMIEEPYNYLYIILGFSLITFGISYGIFLLYEEYKYKKKSK